jgi:hypothetical protein
MPTTPNLALRQSIATLLVQEVGTGDGESSLPEAVVRVYARLAQQLTPLIGAAGVGALAARSLHLAQREFPCLAEMRNPEKTQEPFAQLGPCLVRNQPVARDAAVELLATFAELLGALVGQGLTTRMVGTAWFTRPPEASSPK